jgi:hypothetical protein
MSSLAGTQDRPAVALSVAIPCNNESSGLDERPRFAGETHYHVDASEPSRGRRPWFVELAILGKVLGLNALQIRRLSVTLSAGARMVGACLFARAYFRNRTWLRHFNHVGFHTFLTLVFGVFSRSNPSRRLAWTTSKRAA